MRIGIIGAGQLGQMLGFAARAHGHTCFFLDPAARPPAAKVGPVIQAAFDDRVALAVLAEKCDVLTYEFENVPVDAVAQLIDTVPIYPPLDALRQAQDRLAEKRLFETLDIPIPGYRRIDSAADVGLAAASIGLPMVVKTRRLGYDGKGQAVVHDADQADAIWQQLGPAPLIAEQWVGFDYEVSAIGVRSVDGDIATYCLTHNEHADGILRVSRAPVEHELLTELANDYLGRLLEHLDYVGVLALELFVVGDKLLANEFAPRVHNSGHWTIEGAETSQFSNHILTVAGERPRATGNRGHAGMVNLIGSIPAAARQLETGTLHDYSKEPRGGRKLGHVTVVADTARDRDRLLDEVGEIVTESKGSPGTGA